MNAEAGTAKVPSRRSQWLLIGGFAVAVICAGAMIFSGIGYRLGLWHFRTGFAIIRWTFWGAAAAVVLIAAGLLIPAARSRAAMVLGAIGLVVAALALYVPWSWKRTLDSVPYIHDITTDLGNPPAFVAVKNVRKEGDHPVEYDGPEVAEQQRKAYPDLAPLVVSHPPEKVFEAAKAVIVKMGMELVDASPQEMRIEATDTSLLYGFKDDVVVRITTNSDGTQVDVRSKSRVGRSDLGQNAKRIRAFLAKLQAELA
ncbi:MAG TPA: DUF1499 domain-containing protein [Burkholderiales bacterium]|jgi:uncharacterized protein (DUF1499 family)|nr:DUF1499 domain-containing protein [Burkholderiales bacterium]